MYKISLRSLAFLHSLDTGSLWTYSILWLWVCLTKHCFVCHTVHLPHAYFKQQNTMHICVFRIATQINSFCPIMANFFLGMCAYTRSECWFSKWWKQYDSRKRLKIRMLLGKIAAQVGKTNKNDTIERTSHRLTERRGEWIYFLASDIPHILPPYPAVGTPVGLHLPNQAPATFVCVWTEQAEEGSLKFPAFQPRWISVQDQT